MGGRRPHGRFLWDCVEHFNLEQFYANYGNEGAPPYDPQMMLATLLYAWCTGIRSSRRIAKACEDQVAFRWLTGNIQPDHREVVAENWTCR